MEYVFKVTVEASSEINDRRFYIAAANPSAAGKKGVKLAKSKEANEWLPMEGRASVVSIERLGRLWR